MTPENIKMNILFDQSLFLNEEFPNSLLVVNIKRV